MTTITTLATTYDFSSIEVADTAILVETVVGSLVSQDRFKSVAWLRSNETQIVAALALYPDNAGIEIASRLASIARVDTLGSFWGGVYMQVYTACALAA